MDESDPQGVRHAILRMFSDLQGRTIASVVPLSETELEILSWKDYRDLGIKVILDDGSYFIPSSGQSGFGAGWMILSAEMDAAGSKVRP